MSLHDEFSTSNAVLIARQHEMSIHSCWTHVVVTRHLEAAKSAVLVCDPPSHHRRFRRSGLRILALLFF